MRLRSTLCAVRVAMAGLAIRPTLGLAIALTFGLSGVCLYAQTAGPVADIYTCVDGKGRKLTSDRPIIDCLDREQKLLNPSGTVKARLGPALTAQERLVLEAKNKAEQDERTSHEEEKRRDKALLVRYPNLASHQKERAEALAQIMVVKQAAATRVAELQAERKKLTDEQVFYVKDLSKIPPKLHRQIDEITQTLAAQERFMAEQDNEIHRINVRFDDELVRLTTLWRVAAGVDTTTKSP